MCLLKYIKLLVAGRIKENPLIGENKSQFFPSHLDNKFLVGALVDQALHLIVENFLLLALLVDSRGFIFESSLIHKEDDTRAGQITAHSDDRNIDDTVNLALFAFHSLLHSPPGNRFSDDWFYYTTSCHGVSSETLTQKSPWVIFVKYA